MVSKMIRRTPTKSLKDCTRRNTASRRRKTPIKSTSSVVIATINDSFFTCRRRLVKIFSKLVKITTPKRTPKKQGFIKLKKNPIFPNDTVLPSPKVSKSLFMGLPPLSDPDKMTVFLDLDETLIHSRPDPPPHRFDFMVQPIIEGVPMNFYVVKRPGADEFLDFLGGKFEVVIFTAGLREYASLVLDGLDKKGVISHRLYRDSCRELDGKFVKDLAQMGRDMWKVVIVDDNPSSYGFQPENAIQIRPFIDDFEDNELEKLVKFFKACDGVQDIRDAIRLFGSSQICQV